MIYKERRQFLPLLSCERGEKSMKNTIEQEIQRVLANMDRQDEQEQEADAHTPEE